MKNFNIYLLRHGEITHKNSLAGHTDFEVTDVGHQQMANAVSILEFEQCISSPLRRCREFAELVSNERDVNLTIEPNIMEMNFGDWDGKGYELLWQQPRPNIGDFWQNPFQNTPPNGEDFGELVKRVNAWWHLITQQINQDTLVITHAGVIKCLLATLLAEGQDQNQIEKIATMVSVSYGHVVHLTCFKGENNSAYVQVKL